MLCMINRERSIPGVGLLYRYSVMGWSDSGVSFAESAESKVMVYTQTFQGLLKFFVLILFFGYSVLLPDCETHQQVLIFR